MQAGKKPAHARSGDTNAAMEVVDTLAGVPAADWNRLAGGAAL